MSDCIFCKIIKGEIPSYRIYEDENTLAFLDVALDFLGHTLVIPKIHCENILNCPPEILKNVTETVQKVCKHYIENCGFDGINVYNANGKAAFQSVFHLHIHIIPQIKTNPVETWPKGKTERNFNEEQTKYKI